jgi:curved DNA-binding protein CbpA
MPSHYDLLGVPATACDTEIKAAYKRRALACHPDKGGSEEEFKAIAAAYAALSDPASRREYDESLSAPPRSWNVPAPRGSAAAAPPVDLDFAERLFQDFFARESPIFGGGPFLASPFGAPFSAFGGSPFGASPFGAFGAPFGGSAGGFASFSSSSSSWSSGGPARSVERSSTFENGVRITRTRETLTHADGRVEVLRDETERDDSRSAGGASRLEQGPSRRALPGPPTPRRAHTYGGHESGPYHTRI